MGLLILSIFFSQVNIAHAAIKCQQEFMGTYVNVGDGGAIIANAGETVKVRFSNSDAEGKNYSVKSSNEKVAKIKKSNANGAYIYATISAVDGGNATITYKQNGKSIKRTMSILGTSTVNSNSKKKNVVDKKGKMDITIQHAKKYNTVIQYCKKGIGSPAGLRVKVKIKVAGYDNNKHKYAMYNDSLASFMTPKGIKTAQSWQKKLIKKNGKLLGIYWDNGKLPKELVQDGYVSPNVITIKGIDQKDAIVVDIMDCNKKNIIKGQESNFQNIGVHYDIVTKTWGKGFKSTIKFGGQAENYLYRCIKNPAKGVKIKITNKYTKESKTYTFYPYLNYIKY